MSTTLKEIALSLLGFIMFAFVAGGMIYACTNENDKSHKISTNNSKDNVYICTGTQSKRYHKTEDCIGLSKCSRSIEEISIEEAEELGRTPCGYCY